MLSPNDKVTEGHVAHANVTAPLLAPMPSAYKDDPFKSAIYELEHTVFDEDELRQKASEVITGLQRHVGLHLLPASMVVMEKFSDEYAQKHVRNEDSKRRQNRMKMQYQIGSIVGLTASCLALSDHIYKERHVHDVTSIQQNHLLVADQPPVDEIRDTDPKMAKMARLVGEHTAADVAEKDYDQAETLILATTTGYHVSRALARLAIERF